MKKIVKVFVSIIAFGLITVSCNKDDDKETSIEGKWIISKEGAKVNGQEALVDHVHAVGCEKDYTLFSANGVAKDYDFTKVGTTCDEDIETYSYVRDGSKLTVTFDDESQVGTIENLSDTELKVSVTNEEGTFIAVFTKG